MNDGRKQSHNSPTTAKSFLIFASSFAVFGLSLEMWIVDTSFLMRISFGHNKTVVVFAVTQLLSTKNQLLCVYSFYIAILFFYFVCVCAREKTRIKSGLSLSTHKGFLSLSTVCGTGVITSL